jgi:sugar phosphate isomerase/epimerase
MKLGFVSAILPEQTLDQVLTFASSEGFACVELMCWPLGKAERRYAGVTHLDVTELSKDSAAKVRDSLRASGVAVSGLGYYPNVLSPDEAEAAATLAHLRKVIQAAGLLDIGLVNTFIGRDPRRSVDENWPGFLKTWPDLVKLAEESQVRIGIENCPMFFSNDEWPGGKNLAVSPAIWRRIFEAIPSPNLGLNYDPSHLVWQRMDYLKPLREFAGRIFHVHAKDVRVDFEKLDDVGILATPLQFHCPKLPGLGEINWGRFFSVLGDSGYTGPVCIEVEDRAYEGSLQRRQTALRQSAAFLRNFMG